MTPLYGKPAGYHQFKPTKIGRTMCQGVRSEACETDPCILWAMVDGIAYIKLRILVFQRPASSVQQPFHVDRWTGV